jgi:predicted Zn-ribbon and HTH transcriptional regulator
MPDSKPKAQPMWAEKYPVLEEAHGHDLDQRAAINEFHRKMPRDQAESAAHEDYRKEHSHRAAAHHLQGMKAAQSAGYMDEAKKHGEMYALHMKALGHDPMGPVPPEIKAQAEDPKFAKVYQFKNHGADTLLSHSLSKGEVIEMKFPWKCKTCTHEGRSTQIPKECPKCMSQRDSIGEGHGPHRMQKSEDEIPACPKCKSHDTEYSGLRLGKNRQCVNCKHRFSTSGFKELKDIKEESKIVKSEPLQRLLAAAKAYVALRSKP